MENSLMLGLYHGFIYGIVPMAPWLVALKRYLYDGKQKGQLAVAGTIAGQVVFFAMAYFGWRDLIQVWYLLEPALFCVGFSMLSAVALDLWVNMTRGDMDMQYGPVRTRREGFTYFFASFLLMFCNPWELEGTQYVFMSSIPENVILYLLAFTLTATATVVVLWGTVGHRIFGTSQKGARYFGKYTAKRLALMLTTCMALSLFNTNMGQIVLPYTDNFMTYLPRTFDRSKLAATRGYFWSPGPDPENLQVAQQDKQPNVFFPEKDKRKEATVTSEAEGNIHYTSLGNRNRGEVRVSQDGTDIWATDLRYNNLIRHTKTNAKRERYIEDETAYKAEVKSHQWGPAFLKLQGRAETHAILPKPSYEKHETFDYVQELAKIRHEVDQNLFFLVPPAERSNYLPYSVDLNGTPYINELDIRFTDNSYKNAGGYDEFMQARATTADELSKIKKNASRFIESVRWEMDQYGNRFKPAGTYHLMNLGYRGVELSYAKLHELPAQMRVPWHYTTVPSIQMRQTVTEEQFFKMSKEEVREKEEAIYAQLSFLSNSPARIVSKEFLQWLPHVIRTNTRYPVPADVVAEQEARTAERREAWIAKRTILEEMMPMQDLLSSRADVRRDAMAALDAEALKESDEGEDPYP
jgi:hypothetical protein